MKKPNSITLQLYALGRIHGIFIEQRQTGTDTAHTYCELEGTGGKVNGAWSLYSKYLTVSVSWDSIAELKNEYNDAVIAWIKFQDQNSAEFKEYIRLKDKFEPNTAISRNQPLQESDSQPPNTTSSP